MNMNDKSIKTLKIGILENGRIKNINVIEKDIIDFTYKKNGKKISLKGELVKIGIKNKKPYLVVLDYNYNSEDNVHFVPTSDIVKITNVVHSGEKYSFSPMYSPDESVLLLRQKDGVLEYTADGNEWNSTSGNTTDFVYDTMVSLGYTGTVQDMARTLKELCENSDNIVAFEFIDEE